MKLGVVAYDAVGHVVAEELLGQQTKHEALQFVPINGAGGAGGCALALFYIALVFHIGLFLPLIPSAFSHKSAAAVPADDLAGKQVFLNLFVPKKLVFVADTLLLDVVEVFPGNDGGATVLNDNPLLLRLIMVAVAFAVYILGGAAVEHINAGVLWIAYRCGNGVGAEGSAVSRFGSSGVQFLNDGAVPRAFNDTAEDIADVGRFFLVDNQMHCVPINREPVRRDTSGVLALISILLLPFKHLAGKIFGIIFVHALDDRLQYDALRTLVKIFRYRAQKHTVSQQRPFVEFGVKAIA